MISFIVIGKNEGWKLKKCLLSIQDTINEYNLEDYEIIYVDSDSNDGSIEFADQLGNVSILKITNYSSAAVARNVGADFSKGDILFFLDGDMEIITPNLKHFFNKTMDKLIYPFISGDFMNCYYKDKLSNDIISKSPYHNIKMTAMQATTGGLFLIEKELWDKVGGIRSEFRINEDLDLGLRLSKKGTLLKRLSHILVNHHTEINDKTRFWHYLKKGNFLYKGILFRKNMFNKHLVKKLFREEITLSLLILGMLSALIFSCVIFMYLYFFAVFIRVLRKSNISNIIQNYTQSIVIDVNTILGFIFFYPKSEKKYKVKVIKQLKN